MHQPMTMRCSKCDRSGSARQFLFTQSYDDTARQREVLRERLGRSLKDSGLELTEALFERAFHHWLWLARDALDRLGGLEWLQVGLPASGAGGSAGLGFIGEIDTEFMGKSVAAVLGLPGASQEARMRERGTIDRATVYPRGVIDAAMRHGAAHLLLAHNHPNGDFTSTEQDKTLTRAIILAGAPLDIHVYDHLHLIVTADEVFSFREAGLL